jgi:hypothetical protein
MSGKKTSVKKNARPNRLPPFTQAFIDRFGTPRFYLRRRGIKRVPLPGLPWSREFMEARERALGGEWAAPKIGERKTVAGTVNAALVGHYQSTAFTALGKSTQNDRRRILEKFRAEHGDKRMALMSGAALQIIVNKKSPIAAKNFKKAMTGFIKYAQSLKLIDHDPLADVTFAKTKHGPGHLPWISEECDQFEATHAIGTKARLAYELLLQLGHSKCDVVRVGPQHIKDGELTFHRKKTKVGSPFRSCRRSRQRSMPCRRASGTSPSSSPNRASRSRPTDSEIGFEIAATKQDFRARTRKPASRAARRTVCARLRPYASPIAVPPSPNSCRGLVGARRARQSATSKPPTDGARPRRRRRS